MNTLIESVYRLFRHSLTRYTYQEPKNIFEKIMNAAGKKEEIIPFYLGKEHFGDEYKAYRYYGKMPALETIKWDEILKEIPLCHTMTNPTGNDVIVPFHLLMILKLQIHILIMQWKNNIKIIHALELYLEEEQ